MNGQIAWVLQMSVAELIIYLTLSYFFVSRVNNYLSEHMTLSNILKWLPIIVIAIDMLGYSVASNIFLPAFTEAFKHLNSFLPQIISFLSQIFFSSLCLSFSLGVISGCIIGYKFGQSGISSINILCNYVPFFTNTNSSKAQPPQPEPNAILVQSPQVSAGGDSHPISNERIQRTTSLRRSSRFSGGDGK